MDRDKTVAYMDRKTNTKTDRLGIRLAYLLRHDADAFERGLIDENGWRGVAEIAALGCGLTRDAIEEITATNSKRRYEFNADRTKIRARQGHSIPVDAELREAEPPRFLYHGTSTENAEKIAASGKILPMSRLYVHLSGDPATAEKVGQRHGRPEVLKIDAHKMREDGIPFWLSRNGVWLVKEVDGKYVL